MRVTPFLRLASDDRLVELLRDGSDSAFEVLFDRYHRKLLAFCRQMVGSAEEAEDVVQHTFLAAYRELPASKGPMAVRPWLYAVARNRCVSLLRGRRPEGSDDAEPETEHLAAAVERRQDLRDLLGDLAGLPDDQRAALVLAELGDVSYPEIALVLGCRREKVKALVFQARSSLIAARAARETPCAEIRTQLANLRGSSLRRSELRRHLGACPGCRAFRDEVRAQRRALALVLPVVPTVGLKSAVLGAAGSATVAGGGGATAAATAVVAVTLAAGGAAGVDAIRDDAPPRPEPNVRVAPPPARAAAPGALGAAASVPISAPARDRDSERPGRAAGQGPEGTRQPAAGRRRSQGRGRAVGPRTEKGGGRAVGPDPERARGRAVGPRAEKGGGRAVGPRAEKGGGRAVGPRTEKGGGRAVGPDPERARGRAVGPRAEKGGGGRAVGPDKRGGPTPRPGSGIPSPGSPGRAVGPPSEPPGQAKKPTGQTEPPPAHPGQAEQPPGQAKTPPGQAKTPPGQAKKEP